MSNKRKSIALINLSPPYGMKASTLVLATQHCETTSVLQVLVMENELSVNDLLLTDDENSPRKQPINKETIQEILDTTHTVVIPDSMLASESRIFHSDLFVEYGLEPLKQFYQDGNTVIIVCFEGIFSVGQTINDLFGTNWKVQLKESSSVEPTERGHQLLGDFAPKNVYLQDNPFFVECPKDEGLYQVQLMTREQFEEDFYAQDAIFEKMGIEKDETLTCFNVEKSWEGYLEKNRNQYAIAVHHDGKGHVVWSGDRGQSDAMSFVFCKMLNIGTILRNQNEIERLTTGSEIEPSHTIDWQWIVALLILLVAVVLRFLGVA